MAKEKVEEKKKQDEEDSELEEILEESEENSKEKKDSDERKKNPRKKNEISTDLGPRQEGEFLRRLNRRAAVSLDVKNPFQVKNLELDLEEEPKPEEKKQNSRNEGNGFEYIPKNEQEKSEGVYRHYENLDNAKMMRQDEFQKFSSKSPLSRNIQKYTVHAEEGKLKKEESHYAPMQSMKRFEELNEEKKEKGQFFIEAKKEYYSHE